jgi:hypothetical protein
MRQTFSRRWLEQQHCILSCKISFSGDKNLVCMEVSLRSRTINIILITISYAFSVHYLLSDCYFECFMHGFRNCLIFSEFNLK